MISTLIKWRGTRLGFRQKGVNKLNNKSLYIPERRKIVFYFIFREFCLPNFRKQLEIINLGSVNFIIGASSKLTQLS